MPQGAKGAVVVVGLLLFDSPSGSGPDHLAVGRQRFR